MKQYYEALYLYPQTSDRMQYFTVFQDKLHSANIQDDQSWAFTETVQKKFQNHLYGKQVLTFDKRQICSASRVECLSKH